MYSGCLSCFGVQTVVVLVVFRFSFGLKLFICCQVVLFLFVLCVYAVQVVQGSCLLLLAVLGCFVFRCFSGLVVQMLRVFVVCFGVRSPSAKRADWYSPLCCYKAWAA